MAFVDIEKGWPNVYAVDLAIPVAQAEKATLVEGMVIHNDGGVWKKGCPAGFMPYVTGPQQYPSALDVERNVDSTFAGFPGGYGEMGAGNMGGVSLANAIVFVTDQFDGLVGGEVVYSDEADGQLKEAADGEQICGWCREVKTDEYGRSLAVIEASVVLQAPAAASSSGASS